MHELISQDEAGPARPEVDAVQPFLLESSGIRGNLVRLGPAVDRVVTRRAYPGPIPALLGELLALTAMLSSMLKYEGVFTLQTKGDGPVGMMVADMTSDGHLRGYAGFTAEKLADALDGAEVARAEQPDIAVLLGTGHLAFTVDQGPHTDRYQGIVDLTGRTLADCLQHYFRQSEQINSGLIVAAEKIGRAWRAGGLVLQGVPERVARAAHEDAEEAWRRAMILQASCTRAELLDPSLPMNDLLYRLFHEEGVRVFRRRPLAARCRCSRRRLVATLRAMPRAEIEDLQVDGEVVVTCEFCGKTYRFDSAGLDRIYAS